MEISKIPGVKINASVSRERVREALATLRLPDGGEASWCIACGASSSAKLSDRVSLPEDSRQLLDPKELNTFVKSMRDLGERAWCIACGAGKDVSPLEKFSNPAEIPDAVIDDLANKLIGSIDIG